MSEATGSPGKSWILVTAPIRRNGIASAKTSRKKATGDLPFIHPFVAPAAIVMRNTNQTLSITHFRTSQ